MSEELPHSWIWSTIGKVCHNPQYGWTTKASKTGLLRFVRTTDITSGIITWETVPFCEKEPKDKEKYLLKDGDIVISRAGSVGNSLLIKSPQQSVFASYLIRFMPLIDEKYVAYFLKSSHYWNSISESKIGIAVPNVNATKLKKITIPVAPLNEQHRIVTKIEELFTRLDAGVNTLKQAQAQLKRYRQSVLKAAVEGKLTAEWREQHLKELETADKLLERILKERREKWDAEQLAKYEYQGKTPPKNWQDKYKEPIPPNIKDLPELPEGWAWTTAEQLSDETRSITYGVVKLGNEVDEGIPTLRSSNVRHLEVDSTKIKKISKGVADKYKRTYLKGGEVLITVRGTLGGVISVMNEFMGYNISREVAMIALIRESLSKCMALFIGSPAIQKWLTNNTRGVAYTGININTLKRMPIPLVPESERLFIEKKVDQLISVSDKIKTTIDVELYRIQSLRQSILNRAFKGKLVPQDPNDEPASILLERIKAEKATPKKSKKMEMF